MERPEKITISKDLVTGDIISKDIADPLERILFTVNADIVKTKNGTKYEYLQSAAYITQVIHSEPGKQQTIDRPMISFEYGILKK